MSAQSLIIAVLLAFTLMDDMAAKPVDADTEEAIKAITQFVEISTPFLAINHLE